MKPSLSDRMVPPSAALAAILLAFGFPAAATAATDKSGIIAGETWTPAMSPIRVVGNITVANLTIQPGVEVIFTGNFEFDCQGVLTAVGNAANKIWFHGDTGPVTWKGINFLNSLDGSMLDYCIVENSNDHGIAITNSGPAISNCEIKNNTTSGPGGGIYILINVAGTPIPTLVNCEITSNNCTVSGGGGVYYELNIPGVAILSGCKVNNNSASPAGAGGAYFKSGSANAVFRMTDSEINDNSCSRTNGVTHGAGGYFSGVGKVEMLRCVIHGNQSNVVDAHTSGVYYSQGGGLYLHDGTLSLRNCDIQNNKALTNGNSWAAGGGLYVRSGDASLYNCLINNNVASSSGGSYGAGINLSTGTLKIENCTIANNNTEGINGESTLTVLNSILFFNNSNGTQVAGSPTITYSDVQNGYAGMGNINQSPLLNADYTLNAFSPCVDTGNPDPSFNDGCLYDAVNRPYGGKGGPTNDMGAYGGPGNVLWKAWSGQLEFLLLRGPGTYRYGDTVTLQAWLNGFPYSCQWFKNGVPVVDAPPRVTGATTDTLTILNAGTTDIGNYQLVCDEIDTSGAVALKPLDLELVPDTAATHITVRAAPGKTFRVQCSDTMAPGSWSTLSQFVLPSSPHTIDDTERASHPKRFYRATEVTP